jgi:Uma2 family endonuclease
MTEHQALDTVPQLAKLTARDFWLLADAGAFDGYARTELIEGEIWVVNSVHRWHARVMALMTAELVRSIAAAGLPLEVLAAGSVSMSNDSIPEPDISVIAPLNAQARTIEREELKIAVEISDTTLDQDLGRKAQLYASHGVPEYWVVGRDQRTITRMSSPAEGAYTERRQVRFGEALPAATIPGLIVETAGIV